MQQGWPILLDTGVTRNNSQPLTDED
jgi:hypothetical protein